jgi:hypothetical protein
MTKWSLNGGVHTLQVYSVAMHEGNATPSPHKYVAWHPENAVDFGEKLLTKL